MWFSKKSLVAVVALGLVASLSACGFRPMYAKTEAGNVSPVSAELAKIKISNIPDRLGQQLRTSMVNQMNPKGTPSDYRYILNVALEVSRSGIAQTMEGKATMGRLLVRADYVLLDATDGRPLYKSSAISNGLFRYIDPGYGSVVAERDSETTVINDIAMGITTHLSAYFTQNLQPK